MDPFKDASYEQLETILAIVNSEQARKSLSLDFLLTWTAGVPLHPDESTASFINFWGYFT